MNRSEPHNPRVVRPLRPVRPVRATTVLLVVLCAAMTFGGTFTCKGSNNGSDYTKNPSTGA
jgi:hypothetical protein